MTKIRFTIEIDGVIDYHWAQRIRDGVNARLYEDLNDLLRSYVDGDDAGDYADHEVAITYPATCGPTPHTIVTSNRRHFRKHCSDMTDEVWTCVQQALSSGLRPIMADTDGGRVGPVSFKPLQKGGSVVRIHDRHAGHDGVLIYTAVTVGDCLCDISRIAYIAALEQGVTVTVGCVIAEPVRRGQGGAA